MRRVALAALAGVLLTAPGFPGCSLRAYSGPVETLTAGYVQSEAAGLVYIAEDRGFFAANRVNFVPRYFSTGPEALEAMLKGEVDIGGSNEVPFIGKVFARERISVYASVDKVQFVFLVGRKDRGIETPGDLKGKRIGLPRSTIAEFYLGRFLNLNGLSPQDVTLVNTAPQASVEAINSGGLDGVVIWNPFAYQMRRQMGDKATLMRLQANQPSFGLAIARNDWLAGNRALLERSLKAVLDAEEYLINRPAEARAIVQKRMNYDDAYMESIWSDNQFSLSLHQSLVATLEDQARWMIGNNLAPGKQVPDFLDYIHLDALKEVRPEAVRIVR